MQVAARNDKYSSKYYPDAIRHWEQKGHYFYFHTSETILEVKVVNDQVIRFRYAADGFFQRDFSYAISGSSGESGISRRF